MSCSYKECEKEGKGSSHDNSFSVHCELYYSKALLLLNKYLDQRLGGQIHSETIAIQVVAQSKEEEKMKEDENAYYTILSTMILLFLSLVQKVL